MSQSSRGEASFSKLPGFAARLYRRMGQGKNLQRQYAEIATYLTGQLERGRVLDVGTGPGWLLLQLHKRNPQLQLYGLDISAAMVELAHRLLAGVAVELRQGSIEHSGYEDDFFDLVTASGSLYLWDRPLACLDEIHRILKPGCSAWLFESYRDYEPRAFQLALQGNLQQEGWATRQITPHFLKRQLRMTYSSSEVEALLQQSRFAGQYQVDKVTLAGLPIWLRIRLDKPAQR